MRERETESTPNTSETVSGIKLERKREREKGVVVMLSDKGTQSEHGGWDEFIWKKVERELDRIQHWKVDPT